MGNPPMLSEAHWIWPVVFFAYDIESPHTIAFTGRGAIKGMKGSLSRATVELSVEGLSVRGRLTGTTHLRVAAADLVSCEIIGDSANAVEVRFTDADWSRLARMLVSGAPAGARDRVILNVRAGNEWKAEIDRLIAST